MRRAPMNGPRRRLVRWPSDRPICCREDEMNVANLQLEGMLLAFTAVLRSLVTSGALTEAQLKAALTEAEQAGLGDRQRCNQLSPSQRDSLAFAARFLTVATRSETAMRSFSEVAREVGRTT
jgi:hypothetical protein